MVSNGFECVECPGQKRRVVVNRTEDASARLHAGRGSSCTLRLAFFLQSLRRRGGEAGFDRQQGLRFFHRNAAKLISGRQFRKTAEAEIFEEQLRGAVVHRMADYFGASRLLDQAALEQGL